ncbi:MAG TPA: hypothetical protein VHD57_00155 [Vicinamibacterales bacterium]|jgi:hypothetical protein|nr:hypothetical protein [Vicinamibacterales bacterium]
MATETKCAHPACDCLVTKGGPFGRFCSEHCREAGETALRCYCHHEGCGVPKPAAPPPAPRPSL